MVVMLTVAALRAVFAPEVMHLSVRWLLVLAVSRLLAAAGIVVLRRFERAGRAIPTWMWVSNVVFESLLPTAVIAILWRSGAMSAKTALTAPPIMAYAVVLILAPLRL